MRATIASHAVIWVAMAAVMVVPSRGGVPAATVSGRVTLMDRGKKPPTDVAQTVVWLEGAARPVSPRAATVITEGKEFRPRVSVISVGSTVSFPNNDPFNHNVFSLSQEGSFDLGLYGRGQSQSSRFNRAGIIRVYCNVHATMAAFIVVRDNPFFAQPAGDGTFAIADVPPGKYVLHVWHERAPEITRDVEVGPEGAAGLDLPLDARGYKFVEHLNKFGQPYSEGGARY